MSFCIVNRFPFKKKNSQKQLFSLRVFKVLLFHTSYNMFTPEPILRAESITKRVWKNVAKRVWNIIFQIAKKKNLKFDVDIRSLFFCIGTYNSYGQQPQTIQDICNSLVCIRIEFYIFRKLIFFNFFMTIQKIFFGNFSIYKKIYFFKCIT